MAVLIARFYCIKYRINRKTKSWGSLHRYKTKFMCIHVYNWLKHKYMQLIFNKLAYRKFHDTKKWPLPDLCPSERADYFPLVWVGCYCRPSVTADWCYRPSVSQLQLGVGVWCLHPSPGCHHSPPHNLCTWTNETLKCSHCILFRFDRFLIWPICIYIVQFYIFQICIIVMFCICIQCAKTGRIYSASSLYSFLFESNSSQ